MSESRISHRRVVRGSREFATEPGKVVTWSFATNPGTQASPFSDYVTAQYQQAIDQAMQTWADLSGLTLRQISDSVASDIRVGWGDFATSTSGVVGFTQMGNLAGGQFQPGVIVRLEDPAETALMAGGSGQLTYTGTPTSLYEVALHEIGHALGLADNSDPGSIMFPELGTGNASPDSADISDIRSLHEETGTLTGPISPLTQAMASFGASSAPPMLALATALTPQESPLTVKVIH
jgi:predicted Zn-dependent protease